MSTYNAIHLTEENTTIILNKIKEFITDKSLGYSWNVIKQTVTIKQDYKYFDEMSWIEFIVRFLDISNLSKDDLNDIFSGDLASIIKIKTI